MILTRALLDPLAVYVYGTASSLRSLAIPSVNQRSSKSLHALDERIQQLKHLALVSAASSFSMAVSHLRNRLSLSCLADRRLGAPRPNKS